MSCANIKTSLATYALISTYCINQVTPRTNDNCNNSVDCLLFRNCPEIACDGCVQLVVLLVVMPARHCYNVFEGGFSIYYWRIGCVVVKAISMYRYKNFVVYIDTC